MINHLPIVVMTYDDLLQLRHSFDTECAALERGLTERQYRPETVFSLFLESQGDEKGSFDEEYRFQQRALAICRGLMDYIDKSVRVHAEVVLGTSDFFHFLRVALDAGAPASKSRVLNTIQSHSFVSAVTQHRGVILQLAPPFDSLL